ncbi:Las1-domain-containing protein [Corynespora cassiicola Philippines]|uniref:Las1-domain-containing protein n=1 Tax=Corynespora cassiicola Philippines TaxID=1448308 RepID=A0A2T2NKX6_CORCC|nr:Las1-domain-containing protein [Corynespora cassiicola Philippines]
MDIRFVVTPWRAPAELLQLRRDLYCHGEDSIKRRQNAVNKVSAWRSRKQEIPLLLDSTADLVDVVLQDDQDKVPHGSLRLLYATAISRFITGLSDTQTTLIRDRPSWFPPGQTIHLPTHLLETRHRIVHRHLPTLAELKLAAKASLDWLWEWYWSQLDSAFSLNNPLTTSSSSQPDSTLTTMDLKSHLQTLLKPYLRTRKSEIKNKTKSSNAATTTLSALNALSASHSPAIVHTLLLQHLTTPPDHAILPTDKKLDSSMSGAFLIWTPLLLALCSSSPTFLPRLLAALTRAMNTPRPASVARPELDPVRQGMCEWVVHVLSSAAWRGVVRGSGSGGAVADEVLGRCFTAPSYWNVRLAGLVLEKEGAATGLGKAAREGWRDVLEVACVEEEDGEGMDVDFEGADGDVAGAVEEVRQSELVEGMVSGPQKRIGLWKPRPIGALPLGWEEDE